MHASYRRRHNRNLVLYLFGPKADVALMNVASFDAFILGNHEFDNGDSTVAKFSRLLKIPVLSYNRKFILLATCRLYMSPRREQHT